MLQHDTPFKSRAHVTGRDEGCHRIISVPNKKHRASCSHLEIPLIALLRRQAPTRACRNPTIPSVASDSALQVSWQKLSSQLLDAGRSRYPVTALDSVPRFGRRINGCSGSCGKSSNLTRQRCVDKRRVSRHYKGKHTRELRPLCRSIHGVDYVAFNEAVVEDKSGTG